MSRNTQIDTILVRESDLATATQRNGGAASLVGTLAEVRNELFGWDALAAPVEFGDPNGGTHFAPSSKVIYRSDTFAPLGVVGSGYQVHGYGEWLADNLAHIVDDSDVVVQSAGLLSGGARAWVQISTPGISSVSDFEYRPFILAGTSLDGSTATIYKRNAIAIVCQNTYAASMSGAPDLRIKHTSRSASAFQLNTARAALDVMFSITDEFSSELVTLLNTKVSDAQFEGLIKSLIGEPQADAKTTRSQTIWDAKFDALTRMWNGDARVAPWRGTGLGAMQAFSTYQQHEASVRGATRAERNADRLLSGEGDRFDARIRELIAAV